MRKRKAGELPRMILDYNMCIRVEPGEQDLAGPTTPYRCNVCGTVGRNLTVSGKLRLSGSPVPKCEDHDPAVEMESV